MEVKIIRVEGKQGIFKTTIDTEETIKSMYSEGYTIKAVIPAIMVGYGSIAAVDLVFER